MAYSEHDRWMRDLETDGWKYADGAKDPHKKLHPLLVPWEQLDEPAREKDRDAIRALPQVLARVGYSLQIPSH